MVSGVYINQIAYIRHILFCQKVSSLLLGVDKNWNSK